MSKTLSFFYPDPITGMLKMGFNKGPQIISGVQILLDKIAYLLQTNVGSNYFTPLIGCVLAQQSKLTGSPKDETELKLVVYSAIKAVESMIMTEQALTPDLPPDEQLISLELSDLLQDPDDPTSYLVEVIVNTVSNQSYYLTV